jgi:hypothetical protein
MSPKPDRVFGCHLVLSNRLRREKPLPLRAADHLPGPTDRPFEGHENGATSEPVRHFQLHVSAKAEPVGEDPQQLPLGAQPLVDGRQPELQKTTGSIEGRPVRA